MILSDRREVYDVATGQGIEIDPATNSKTTMFLPQPIVDRLSKRVNPSCDGGLLPDSVVEDGAESILGYDVVKVTENSEMPNGVTMTNEEWRSPQLNCFPLLQRTTVVDSAGIGALNLREVKAVVQAEPGAKLFQIPKGYAERSPSEVVAATERLKGEELCIPCSEEWVTRADQNYYGSQVPRSPDSVVK